MNTNVPSSPQFNPWPWALLAFFVLLLSVIAAFIVFAVGQDMQLVRPDYYEAEVVYQDQIDRLRRTRAIQDEIALAYDHVAQTVELKLPVAHALGHAKGRIHFYRPSDASLDQEIELSLQPDGRQSVSVADKLGGLWKVHVFWEFNGEEFYTKEVLIFANAKS